MGPGTSPQPWGWDRAHGHREGEPCWAQSARWDEGESDMAHPIQRPSRCPKPLGSLQMVVRTRWPVVRMKVQRRTLVVTGLAEVEDSSEEESQVGEAFIPDPCEM